jgi:hypothetical protein
VHQFLAAKNVNRCAYLSANLLELLDVTILDLIIGWVQMYPCAKSIVKLGTRSLLSGARLKPRPVSIDRCSLFFT